MDQVVSKKGFRCELHFCMLTRGRIQRGEGNVEPFDPEVGHAPRRRNMAEGEAHIEEERNFRNTFYSTVENVGKLVLRLEITEERNLEEQGSTHGNGGEEPPPSPSSHYHNHRN